LKIFGVLGWSGEPDFEEFFRWEKKAQALFCSERRTVKPILSERGRENDCEFHMDNYR